MDGITDDRDSRINNEDNSTDVGSLPTPLVPRSYATILTFIEGTLVGDNNADTPTCT